jgi:hypothetical protein
MELALSVTCSMGITQTAGKAANHARKYKIVRSASMNHSASNVSRDYISTYSRTSAWSNVLKVQKLSLITLINIADTTPSI